MKVSIPKSDIEDIMKEYNCTQEEATSAYLAARKKAEDIFKKSVEQDLQSKENSSPKEGPKVYTPRELKKYLDGYVVGQEEYKRRICIAASYHFAVIKFLKENPEQKRIKRFRKKNTIIAGPSGSGKTYCVEVLGDILQVPTLTVDATDYTEAGYVGKSADDMIRELIDMAPGFSRKEQAEFIAQNGGIIFVDEIDKKAKDGALAGHDISREGFQRSVLKLIERKLIPIDNPNSPMSQIQELMERQQGQKNEKKDNMISTENILFILGGSFQRRIESLESLVKKRLTGDARLERENELILEGFGSKTNSLEDKEKYKNYYKYAETRDYIRFGLIPELVGRVPIRTFVNLLSKNDLIRIMEETEDSILSQYKLEFELFDIDLEVSKDAIDYIAQEAENKKTGARALVSVWENILTDFQFELPGSNFRKLKIDRLLCEKPKDYLLKILEKSPFVDFLENFRREYGVELVLDEEIEKYVEAKASEMDLQISATLKKLLSPAAALNYINMGSPYKVTQEMLEDEKYFDKLFIEWHKSQREAEENEE